MNKISVKKRLLICLAVSLVLIIAGAFLLGFLGFNPDNATKDFKSVEVVDNGYMTIDTEYRAQLREFCAKQISEKGYSVSDVSYAAEAAGGSGSLEFVLDSGVAENELSAFVTELDSALASAQYGEEGAGSTLKSLGDISVTYHNDVYVPHYEYIWRTAIAAGVALVILFAYVAIRFKVGMGVTSLVAAVHDVLLTLGVIALFRIPAGTSLICVAMFALLLSAFLNMKVLSRLRVRKNKDASPKGAELSAQDAVALAVRESRKGVLVADILAAAVIVVLAVAGLIAGFDMFSFMIGALVAVVVCTYSSLVLSPAIYTLIKERSDANRAKRAKYNYASEKANKKNANNEEKAVPVTTGEAQS